MVAVGTVALMQLMAPLMITGITIGAAYCSQISFGHLLRNEGLRNCNKLMRPLGRRWFVAVTVGAMLTILALPVAAQTQSLQAWPEVDTYVSLNSDVRVSFFTAATRENRHGTDAEIGPNIDFYFKPLVKLKRITVFELDPSKSRLLMFRVGYRYMPSTTDRVLTFLPLHALSPG